MRKLGIVLVLGVALLLGQTLAAHAVSLGSDPVIHDATSGDQLYQVFNNFNWSSTLTSNSQIAAMPTYEYFLPGTFVITNEYKNAKLSQTPGWSPITAASFNSLGTTYAADGPGNGYWTNLFTLIQANAFCLADKPDIIIPVRYTKWSFNSPMDGQSNGLIFWDQGYVPNATYTYHLIVAFEDGNLNDYNPCGGSDMDYNDLVLNIYTQTYPFPIPGTLPLVGSGLMALAGLGWWRRKKS